MACDKETPLTCDKGTNTESLIAASTATLELKLATNSKEIKDSGSKNSQDIHLLLVAAATVVRKHLPASTVHLHHVERVEARILASHLVKKQPVQYALTDLLQGKDQVVMDTNRDLRRSDKLDLS